MTDLDATQAPKFLAKSKAPRVLTARDLKILRLLGEYGCVSAERIKNYFWNDNSKSRAHFRRIGILKRLLLIENVQGDNSRTIGYRLTKKGKEYFSKTFNEKTTPVVRSSYKTQFEHDQLLIDVRHILQESPLVKNFKIESDIRKETLNAQIIKRNWDQIPAIPDAIFGFQTPEQTMQVAVELELTPKMRSRYTRIFRNHLLSKDWSLVIYIVKDEKFQERLMKILSEIKSTDIHVRIANRVNGIYFCSLEDFLDQRLSAPLTNGKKVISLQQIAQNFKVES